MTEPLENVESVLYGHILKQAFIGFAKSALITAALGAAVGALVSFIPGVDKLIPESLKAFAGSTPLAGALAGAAVSFFPGGAIGATAGVQSARDARRYFRFHEAARADAVLPPEHDQVAAAMPEIGTSYRDKLRAEAQTPPQPGIHI